MDLLSAYNSGIISVIKALDGDQTTPILQTILANDRVLDADYHIGYSADKVISPLLYKYLMTSLEGNNISLEDFLSGSLPVSDYETIFEDIFEYDTRNVSASFDEIIYNRFKEKWVKIWDAIHTAYKPLENYDMTEKDSPNLTKTRSVNTDLTTSTDNDITDTDIYGFNSSSPNPSGKITRNGDVHVTGDAENNIETISDTGYRDLTRHGNIGVTTSQQMLQSELEVRKYDFYKMIYNDIDSILCLKVY